MCECYSTPEWTHHISKAVPGAIMPACFEHLAHRWKIWVHLESDWADVAECPVVHDLGGCLIRLWQRGTGRSSRRVGCLAQQESVQLVASINVKAAGADLHNGSSELDAICHL